MTAIAASRLRGALRVVEYDIAVYRRTWRGSLMVSVVSPVLFLSALGLGLGGLVGRGPGSVGGVDYVRFLAPGLLAGAAMMTGSLESTYPILGRVYWHRIYEGMLATPLRVDDILAGEMAWLLVRLVTVALVNLAVMAAFGAVHTGLAVLVVVFGALTGLAFASPIVAFTATRTNDSGFAALNRFGVTPLYMISGTFFPLSQLPAALQGVAWCFPLAHGVALCRDAVLGDLGAAATAAHVGVLLAYVVAGVVIARTTLTRRLVR